MAYVCPECGGSFTSVPGKRGYALISHMINAGEITVGEAREELASPCLDTETKALLAGWVMDRQDQGEHWAAGDPEVLSCGCRVSYNREQVDVECGTAACFLEKALMPV